MTAHAHAADPSVEHHHPGSGLKISSALGALGIVYGDIGTSPLYALKEAVRVAGSGSAAPEAVVGAVSVILWSLVAIVSVKYAVLILRADNRGEGGIVAMLALLRAREAVPGTWRAWLLIIGLVGAALLYGDGVITPAMSVLSAVEGLKVDAPSLGRIVIPVTAVILVGLFAVQVRGTGFIGRVFGPVMVAWFLAIGLLGLRGIAMHPDILLALNPFRALGYMVSAGPAVSFAVLGAAFLAVTGGEAMYADMGHFGRGAIRLAWFSVVLPCLAINYLGQGGLLLAEPAALDNPFYQLVPDIMHYPMVVFATMATVIASQAIISGVFSLTQQAVQLGFLPRVHIQHTASSEIGQIYIPMANWLLAIGTLSAVFTFESSDALAGAYGIAVSALMAITTILAALVARQWGYNLAAVVAVNGAFLLIDLVFFAANSIKLFEGGWFPLLIAFGIAFLMLTWRAGQRLLEDKRRHLREPDENIARALDSGLIRLPGVGAFLTAAPHGMPLPMSHFIRTNHALQQRVLLITLVTSIRPRVPSGKRTEVVAVAEGVDRLILHHGFMETPSIPRGLWLARALRQLEDIDPDTIVYFLGRETVLPSARVAGMSKWRETIFAFMHRNSERSGAWFGVPAAQAVEIGIEIEI
ncbi:MAG: KUP/HAK/KT family potassium transporter [Parafilimonas terrae]|nr:KUP/HAK/KT family potassium transporter [Parafilimonas terrae]